MGLDVSCPHCGEQLNIPSQYAGQRGACNKCGKKITVPIPKASSIPTAEAAPEVQRSSSRRLWILTGVAISVFVAGAVVTLRSRESGGAEIIAEARTAPIEVGQRVYQAGHSFSWFTVEPLELLANEAGYNDHTSVGQSRIGGATPMEHWNASEDENTIKPALKAGGVDVLILATARPMPEEGIDLFADLAAAHNPNLRLLMYVPWNSWDGQPDGSGFLNEDRDHVTIEEIDGRIESWKSGYMELLSTQLMGINERHNREMAFIIDVGGAVNALRKETIKGNVPGIEKQSQLFADSLGHPGPIVAVLADYVTFATLYRRSPVGMTALDSMPATHIGEAFTPELSPEDSTKLHRLLQKLALEAVLSEPMSGFEM